VATQDLLAGHTAAAALVPGVPAGVFGHSQGGWVVLEALRQSRSEVSETPSPAFGVTSSWPGVSTTAQERFAVEGSVVGLSDDAHVQARAREAAWTVLAMCEAGDSHADLLTWADEPGNADDVELVRRLYGNDLFDQAVWDHFVRLSAFDPVPAMKAVDVPLLVVFGSRDAVTPVEQSVAALRGHVRPDLLRIAVVPDGNHRLQQPDTRDFVPGYPDVIIDFITTLCSKS